MSRLQLERIIKIHEYIRQGHYPHPDKLAEEFGVSRRLIFIDRDFLIRLGADIQFDYRQRGWYYAQPWDLPLTFIEHGDLLAFFLHVEIARRYRGTPLEAPLRAAAEGLAKQIDGSSLTDLNSLRHWYTYTIPPTVQIQEDTLFKLYRAIRQQQQVWIRYYWIEHDEEIERTIHPHHIHSFNENWYVIAYETASQRMHTYNVGRIRRLEPLAQPFERQADFDAKAWMRSTFQGEHGDTTVEVRIWFDAYQARFVREQDGKYDGQRIEDFPDGSVILTLHTSGLGRLKRWILSFGSRAEVLSPPFLREEVAAELVQAAGRYGL